MHYILYASSAVVPFDGAALDALLEVSRCNNARMGITGMLLYHDGNFIQYIEGAEVAVIGLLDRISADPRHRGIIKLDEGAQPERIMPDWTMGHRALTDDQANSLGGFRLAGGALGARLDPGLPKAVIVMMSQFYRAADRFG